MRHPARSEDWWRRRAPPPGPLRLFRTAFITIAGEPALHIYALPAAVQPAGRTQSRSAWMAVDADKQAEIDMLRASTAATRRATVPALESLLYEPLPVLDQGFIRVIDYMGDDAAIVQAARVSYGRGTKQISGDRGLINYLMRHRHTSPFEMCELKLHVKLPIFVARQWIRHRTANVNEYSARYSVLDREFYIPDKDLLKLVKRSRKEEPVQERLFALPSAEHTAAQSATNKQGRDEVLAADTAAAMLREIGA